MGKSKDLSDPQFEAELSYYFGHVEPDVSMYYHKAVSQGVRSSSKIDSCKFAIENLEQSIEGVRSEIKDFPKRSNTSKERKRNISAQISELKYKREDALYGTAQRREYTNKIKSLKREKKELKNSDKNNESRYQKTLRRLSSYKGRLKNRKKELEENKKLYAKAKKYISSCISSARRQFKLIDRVQVIAQYFRTFNFNNLGPNQIVRLGSIQAFLQQCNNLPKVSILNPIDQSAQTFMQAYAQVCSFLTPTDMREINVLQKNADTNRTDYINRRKAMIKMQSSQSFQDYR